MFVAGFMYTTFILEGYRKTQLQYFVLNTIVHGAIYCSLLILSGLRVIDIGGESMTGRSFGGMQIPFRKLWFSWR